MIYKHGVKFDDFITLLITIFFFKFFFSILLATFYILIGVLFYYYIPCHGNEITQSLRRVDKPIGGTR